VREASVNTILSASRLWLPLVEGFNPPGDPVDG
jgi:hypothetical protein